MTRSLSLSSVDEITRDPEDNAYHCPNCDVPFTRRSNLRRHYVIHTRSLPYACTTCDERFSRSDELNYHTLTQCTTNSESRWKPFDSPDSSILQTTPNFPHLTPDFVQANTPPVPTRSPASDCTDIEVDQAFVEFMSSLTPPMPTSFHGFEAPQGNFGTSPDDILTSNMIVASNGPLPASLDIPLPSTRASRSGSTNLGVRQTVRPHRPILRRGKQKEKPIYTRRQVDDMLHAVKDSFVGSIDEIIRRVDTIEKAVDKVTTTTKSDPMRRIESGGSGGHLPDNQLRGLLDGSLPRLLYGLQALIDERKMNTQ